jgi:hypothetical protein
VIRDAQSDVVGHGVIQRETHRQEIDFLPHLDAVDLGERPVPIEKVDGSRFANSLSAIDCKALQSHRFRGPSAFFSAHKPYITPSYWA